MQGRHRSSLPLLVVLMAALEARLLLVIAGDCPLDFSWSNFTSTANACSNQNERAKCCRYINAIIAVSVARYANTSGTLGIPSMITDMCINSVSLTLQLHGVPPNALMFCGLGLKIRVSYQCEGRETILEMLQSPNFSDAVRNCRLPLSSESSCRRCLNSGIIYLHRLIGAQDNVTLNTCRDAAFVALANQGGNLTALDLANCFFSAQGIGILPVNASEPSSQTLEPTSSPSPAPALAPSQRLVGVPVKKHHHSYQLSLILGIGIMVTSVAILLLLIFILLICKKSKELDTGTPGEPSWNTCPPQDWKCQEGPSIIFHRFSYKETKRATQNFSNIVRRGGFGTVCKAQFDDGFMASVTCMQNVTEHDEEEFSRTMELLGRLHHRHLVALRGYCIERHERFLIYDYMANGSVHDHLHSPERTSLAWQTRIQVAFDVANALEYLHFYCDPPFIHGDIKSSNILLDGNFLAKVSNFGVAHASRIGSISYEPVNTDIRGTPGYMDPEYVVTRELNEKSDVYSYGVLLLELVTGRRAVHENQNLVEWSQTFMANDFRLPELVDPAISDSFDLEQLHVVVLIIQWCTQREVSARPTIKQVLRILCERLNPVHNGFSQAIGDEDDDYGERRTHNLKTQQNEVFPHSSDTRCLQSSSSTSRSYCSRSILLENNSPQSPSGVLSV